VLSTTLHILRLASSPGIGSLHEKAFSADAKENRQEGPNAIMAINIAPAAPLPAPPVEAAFVP
jgi:hypothetical protein